MSSPPVDRGARPLRAGAPAPATPHRSARRHPAEIRGPRAGQAGRRALLATATGALGALALLILAPTLDVGYLSDDDVSSLTPGMLAFTGEPLATRLTNAVVNSIRDGRLYPLHFVPFTLVFVAIRDAWAYHLFIVLLVLANLGLAAALVRSLAEDAGLAALSTALTIAAIQFRAYHDPILSFFGLLQLVLGAVLVSLLALDAYLKRGGAGRLAASVVAFLSALLTYELSYPLVALHLLLIASRRRDARGRLLGALPFLAVVAACLAATVAVRLAGRPPDDPAYAPGYLHEFNLDPARVAATLAGQAASALPLSHRLADPSGVFADTAPPGRVDWGRAVAVGALAVAAVASGRRLLGPGRGAGGAVGRGRARLAAMGVGLLFLPALPMSLCSKYQEVIRPGLGYVPVYLQYFGFGMLGAAAVGWAMARVGPARPGSRALGVALAVAVAAATVASDRANRRVCASLVAAPGTPHHHDGAASLGGVWTFPRRNIEAALRAGLLDDVPEGAELILGSDYRAWHTSGFSLFFYAMHAGKRLAVVPPSSRNASSPYAAMHAQLLALHPARPGDRYHLRDTCIGPDVGLVVLWREGLDPDVRLFVRHPGPDPDRPGRVPRLVARAADASGREVELLPHRHLRPIRSDRGGRLVRVVVDGTPIDPGSIRFAPRARPAPPPASR